VDGTGTYSQQLPITLTVPANPRAGTYTATLTVTMVAGP
jgi:spore coat protein U-like protein